MYNQSIMDRQTLARILDLNHILARNRPLKHFFQAALEAANALTGATASIVWAVDDNGRQLLVIDSQPALPATEQPITLPLTKSAAGWAAQYEQPVQLDDAPNEQPSITETQAEFPLRVARLLAIPIRFRSNTLGVIEVFNKEAPFTYEDIAILEHLAVQVGAAIHDARQQTQIKRLRKEIKKLDDLKSNFIAIASHELRTPLGLILGHATFLREIIPDDFKEQMNVVVRNAERLKKLLEDMAQVNNYQAGTARVRARTFSLRDLLHTLAEDYRQQADKAGVQILLDLPDDPLTIHGDEGKLTTAISNLIQNGITFNKPGGELHISATRVPGYTQIRIRDTGIGISAEELPRIFDRFYQVESHLTRQHGGIGLGLSIAKAMIELHGGRIWAESTPGKGSTFTILLPIHTIPTQPGAPLELT